MALQMMLDGKPIGTVGDDGTIRTNDGEPVTTDTIKHPSVKDDDNKVTVPLDPRQDRVRFGTRVKSTTEDAETVDDSDSDEVEDEDVLEDLDPKVRQILDGQQEQIGQILDALHGLSQSGQSGQQDAVVDLSNLDKIPDIDDPKKDPLGIARTLKGLVKHLSEVSTKVNRLDQHTGYREAERHLERAKEDYDVYKDKRTAAIADKLLNAELSTNRRDSMPRIVEKVAKQVEKLVGKSKKEYIKEKAKTASKVPKTMKASDGASPAITVDRPKSVADASKAYAEWRRASRQRTR